MPRRRRGGLNSASKSLNSPNSSGVSSDVDTPRTPRTPQTPCTPTKQIKTPTSKQLKDDVYVARGRFRGALLNAMEYNCDSDTSDHSPSKRERNWNEYKISSQTKRDLNDYNSDNEGNKSDKKCRKRYRKNQKPFSYVMKLFDRSVDLGQFTEDTPLYPICRAWMENNPRKNDLPSKKTKEEEESSMEDGIKLPGPEGHPVSRVPPLLPEQCTRSKYNINLNYNDEPPVSKEVLLKSHLKRWNAIRKKWLEQSVIYESRYVRTQDILNEMENSSF